MTSLSFCKMHGLGNDVVIINSLTQSFRADKKNIQQIAHRHLGIGFDQLLIIKPSSTADFACDIFNADGSEAEQCGNGMRCVARYLYEKKLSPHKTISLETKAGIIKTHVHNFSEIAVEMGIPRFEALAKDIPLEEKMLRFSILSMGNPHAILIVDSVNDFPVNKVGFAISTHTLFPQGINVGFMEIIDRQHIRLRTFERGSGETLACGSNACAAVATGIKQQLLDRQVEVGLALGKLQIEWLNDEKSMSMSGPAEKIFEGSIKFPNVDEGKSESKDV